MSAETKAVAHGDCDAAFAGFVGDEVQIAFGVRIVQVDRGRDHVALNDQGTDDGFHAAAGAQEVAEAVKAELVAKANW